MMGNNFESAECNTQIIKVVEAKERNLHVSSIFNIMSLSDMFYTLGFQQTDAARKDNKSWK